jgi:hypothetical protein
MLKSPTQTHPFRNKQRTAPSAFPVLDYATRAGWQNQPTMLLAAHESRREILGSQLRFMLPTVAPGKNSGVLRIASSVLHILPQTTVAPDSGTPAALVIGQKAAQERFSEESFRHLTSEPSHRKHVSQKLYRKFPHTSTGTHSTQQAWINSRNLSNIATEWKHRQPIFLHPTVGTGDVSAC